MKKNLHQLKETICNPAYYFIFICFFLIKTVNAQVYSEIDNNNIKAGFWNEGTFFWDKASNPRFEVPKNSNKHANFASGLWISGIDDGGMLIAAAQTYNQTGTDYQFGPIATNRSANNYIQRYNKIWKINTSEINYHIQNYNNPNYVIPNQILTWPGNGVVSNGEPAQLAPYFDSNSNNIYDPINGDYPLIKGEQALFYIFNDNKVHTETGSSVPFKFDFYVMAYVFTPINQALNNTVFIDIKIVNKSARTYSNLKLGMWDDPDLGAYIDDFIGCDVGRNLAFVYNSSDIDAPNGENTYGANPPSMGVQFLSHKMDNMMYYINNSTNQGNPSNSNQIDKYLSAKWRDGVQLTYGGSGYGGSSNCNYAFPWDTDSNNPQTWMQTGTANDLRFIPSTNLGELSPNQSICFTMAYTVSFGDSGAISSVYKLKQDADFIKGFYQQNNLLNCSQNSSPLSIINESSDVNWEIFPNPNSGNFQISFISGTEGIEEIEIYSIDGKKIAEYNNFLHQKSKLITLNNRGIYLVKIIDRNKSSYSKKLVVQ
jgi:hypothetical protein